MINVYFNKPCIHKPDDVWCQEPYGCENCCIAQGQKPLDLILAAVNRCGQTIVGEENGEYE